MTTIKKFISLDVSIAKELEAISISTNKFQKYIIESALELYFDYLDNAVADNITKDIKTKSMKIYDSCEVYAKLRIKI